ncbi:hypothetical protein J2X31_003144 [Flavobacterium arsenatis]|uniref:Uncharacterized protein n=1 Tax=Flavobacterium arsenatis TaxID=1484332 RepID=A0ABU1TTD8_9FLAO|nr:hypothetical protein [Flavobacterium arsenatis]
MVFVKPLLTKTRFSMKSPQRMSLLQTKPNNKAITYMTKENILLHI